MDTNYRVAYDKEWEKLKTKNPNDIAKNLGVEYFEESNSFIVTFLYKEYVLDCEKETIYRKEDNSTPSIEASIIILNYLTFSNHTIKQSDKWCSLKEIPNGGMLFYPAFYKSSIKKLIEIFGYNSDDFEVCGKKIGGTSYSMGDKSIVFEVFPKISICVVIWEGDDEISPNATVLFEESIQHLIHIETIIGLGGYVVKELLYKI